MNSFLNLLIQTWITWRILVRGPPPSGKSESFQRHQRIILITQIQKRITRNPIEFGWLGPNMVPRETQIPPGPRPSGPRARRRAVSSLIPWDSLRFMSPGESHKFMSQSERLKTGCTDRESRETSIPPSPRAPRPRGRERMGVPSLGFMDIRGIWRKWKEQKRTNQKIENSKKKKGNRKRAKKTGNRKSTKKL